ncbi:MAG TPA: DUF885 family protein [Burkholderiales bacterium]|nr:DUF885 family protein [Burkholderiales bacterium]
MRRRTLLAALAAVTILSTVAVPAPTARRAADPDDGYQALLSLFADFREFQKPALRGGVPDYSPEAVAAQKRRLPEFERRLAAIDSRGWPAARRVDYEIVRAEMNGLLFDHRALRPWSRVPTFYAVLQVSGPDVPAREGPEVPGVLCLSEFPFPLDSARKAALRDKLAAVPELLDRAMSNLTERTRDLWTLGIRRKAEESAGLADLGRRLAASDPDLVPLVEKARAAVDRFRAWLEKTRPERSVSAGVGVAEYDWYQRNVHLVPYSWAEQVELVRREFERSVAFLGLERQRNRDLPELLPPTTAEELGRRLKAGVAYFMGFLRDREIFTVPGYMRLNDVAGELLPPARRDFFTQVDYRDNLPLLCHSLHWLEKQREARNAHPIRGVPLLYNIWDSRAEGMATAFEEMMLQAGLFDRSPRARELVYILLAFRCARAMADLKLHSGELTLEQAAAYAARVTPGGWVLPDGPTIWGDLGIYLPQPGYGTSYVIGKIQVERLLAEVEAERGDAFRLKEFLDDFFSRGLIPQSLIRWETTGLDDEMRKLGR